MGYTADKIKARLKKQNVQFFANDNISEYLQDDEIAELQEEVALAMQDVLNCLVIDTDNDHNTNGTAARVAKMFVQETFYDCPRRKGT